MSKKSQPESMGCLDKAAPDEPLFILRGQDKNSPTLVRLWAALAKDQGAPPDKVAEAMRCADEMELWPTRKNPD